jgi:hypothetical protein
MNIEYIKNIINNDIHKKIMCFDLDKIRIRDIVDIENYTKNKYGFLIFISVDKIQITYDIIDINENVYNFVLYK